MVKVKICGFTRAQDVEWAVSQGADFIGLVLAPSRRQLTLVQASQLLRHISSSAQGVAVVVDTDQEQLLAIRDAGFTWVQCHGECPERLPAGLSGLRACSGVGWDNRLQLPDPAWHAWLLDGPQSGSGQAFDWQALALCRPNQRFFVAGGLGVDNITSVIDTLRPFGVDVSSGVESSAGIKDKSRVREFIERTRIVHD